MISKFIFSNRDLFENLPQEDKKILKEAMQTKNFRKNEAIYTTGTIPSGIFYIKTGKVKKYKVDNEGREQIICLYSTGELFGYSSVLRDECYDTTTQTIEDSVISFIPNKEFLRIIDNSTAFSKQLLKSFSQQFCVMSNLLEAFSHRTVRERVALCLLILHQKYLTNNDEEAVYITLSRTDLAHLVGTANETLGRILHDFRKDRLILIQGRKIKILDFKKLTHLAHLQ